MKYTTEGIINLPLEEFIAKLDNADNMKHWQKGLVSYEMLEGIPGEVGAKMKLSYDLGKRKMEMVETITHRNMPNELHMVYNAPGMHNIQKNYFSDIDGKSTKWVSESEFTSDKIFYKIMMTLMPGMFKKQSKIYFDDFKAFAEEGKSVMG
jgi:mRNA-degrading endonuclease HigB of HigAB toxin-antitoxin module